MLIDGLDKNWETGVKSFWEKKNKENCHFNSKTPFAIQRLNRLETNIEDSFIIENHDATYLSDLCQKFTLNGKRIVSKMPLSLFRKCLVEHFDIRSKMNDIVWPHRMNKPKF